MARLKIVEPQGSPCWAPTDKDKGKEVGNDIALLLEYSHVPLSFIF
jgi:hypothetical protein